MDLCWYEMKMNFELSFRMGKKEDWNGFDECGWCLTCSRSGVFFLLGSTGMTSQISPGFTVHIRIPKR